MNETMVERVAKALYESDCPYLWEEATEKDKKRAKILAHTVIKAMWSAILDDVLSEGDGS